MNNLILMALKGFFATTSRIAPFIAIRAAEKLFTTPHYSKRREVEFKILENADKFPIRMADGRTLQGYRWGNKQNPIILFVHGWTATATCFMNFFNPLLEQGYQIIAYDAIAHGESPGRSVSMTEWADMVTAAMQKVGKIDCIVAHSLGAGAVIIASSRGLQADKVVLISPLTDIHKVTEQFAQSLSIPERILKKMHQYAWKKYHFSASRYGRDWYDVFRSNFKAPTLLIHDLDDKEISISNSRDLLRYWPWAQLHETKTLGHRRILLNPGVITIAVDFIIEQETLA